MPQTEPVLKLIYRSATIQVPTEVLRKSEVHQQSNALATLVVDGIMKNNFPVAQLAKTGNVVPAISILNLSDTLQPLVLNKSDKYVSSGRLMQQLFAHDFSAHARWENAHKLYKLTLSMVVDKRGISDPGQLDQVTQAAIQNKLQKWADAFVSRLIGEPQTLIGDRLPQPVLDFLIQVDQHFHAQLIRDEKTRGLSTEQMREARIGLQANLLVTHLLKPMLEGIATNAGTKTEQCFAELILKTLSVQVESLAKQVLVKSFAQSSPELREKAIIKEGAEEQAKRTAQRVTAFKSRLGGHQRSRSADTTPIDPRSMREAARSKRKEKPQDNDAYENNPIGNVSLPGRDTVKPFSRHGKTDEAYKPELLSAISLQDFEKELVDELDALMTLISNSATAVKEKSVQTTTTATTTVTAPIATPPATPRRVAHTATTGRSNFAPPTTTTASTTTITTTATTSTAPTTTTTSTTTATATQPTVSKNSPSL